MNFFYCKLFNSTTYAYAYNRFAVLDVARKSPWLYVFFVIDVINLYSLMCKKYRPTHVYGKNYLHHKKTPILKWTQDIYRNCTKKNTPKNLVVFFPALFKSYDKFSNHLSLFASLSVHISKIPWVNSLKFSLLQLRGLIL